MLSGILSSPLQVSAGAKCMLDCQARACCIDQGPASFQISTAGLSYEKVALLQHLQKNGEFDPVSCALCVVRFTMTVLAGPLEACLVHDVPAESCSDQHAVLQVTRQYCSKNQVGLLEARVLQASSVFTVPVAELKHVRCRSLPTMLSVQQWRHIVRSTHGHGVTCKTRQETHRF